MFSLFKKKPKFDNEASEDLAVMLVDCPENPIRDASFFVDKEMDYSVESLTILEEYLESLRIELPEDGELVKVTMRCGSYLGEVVRRNSPTDYNWLEYSDAAEMNQHIASIGHNLGTVSILWAKPGTFLFPLAKILKRLENGAEDNVHSFAKVAIGGMY